MAQRLQGGRFKAPAEHYVCQAAAHLGKAQRQGSRSGGALHIQGQAGNFRLYAGQKCRQPGQVAPGTHRIASQDFFCFPAQGITPKKGLQQGSP